MIAHQIIERTGADTKAHPLAKGKTPHTLYAKCGASVALVANGSFAPGPYVYRDDRRAFTAWQ